MHIYHKYTPRYQLFDTFFPFKGRKHACGHSCRSQALVPSRTCTPPASSHFRKRSASENYHLSDLIMLPSTISPRRPLLPRITRRTHHDSLFSFPSRIILAFQHPHSIASLSQPPVHSTVKPTHLQLLLPLLPRLRRRILRRPRVLNSRWRRG